jgi:CHAD domain-containing protein
MDAVREPAMAPNDLSLPELAQKAFKKLRKAVKALDDTASNTAWHYVRITAKRARYAAELAELCSGRTATRFIEKMKLIQDQLGDIQDARIAEDHLRRFTLEKTGKRSAFLSGKMVECQRQRRRQAKRRFLSTWEQVKKCGAEAWG